MIEEAYNYFKIVAFNCSSQFIKFPKKEFTFCINVVRLNSLMLGPSSVSSSPKSGNVISCAYSRFSVTTLPTWSPRHNNHSFELQSLCRAPPNWCPTFPDSHAYLPHFSLPPGPIKHMIDVKLSFYSIVLALPCTQLVV